MMMMIIIIMWTGCFFFDMSSGDGLKGVRI